MSLQIWLPLNGNINNQGLADWTPAGSGIAYSNSGKIGSCLNSGTITASDKNYLGYEGSIAFWIFIDASSNSTAMLYGNGDMTASANNRKWSLFLYPDRNSLHSWGCMRDNSTSPNGSFFISNVLPDNTWTHVCITHDRSNQYIYINGVLKSTIAWDSTGIFTFTNSTYLFADPAGNRLNDYRIYDHCLSAKEVKEISKGLVLHYKLDNIYETSVRNKYNAPYSQGSYGATSQNADGSYNISRSFTGNGTDSWYILTYPQVSFTAGKKYMWSCKIKVNSCTPNVNLTMRTARMSNDWQCPAVVSAVETSDVGKGWKEIYAFATLQATSDRAGTTYETVPRMEFCSSSIKNSGEVYAMNFDIKDVMVCETDDYIPFIENSMCNNIISDCSGYGNNGIKAGTFNADSGSCRYDIAFIPKNTSTYIVSPSIDMSGFTDTYTISWWSKITDMNGKMAWGFANGNRLNLFPYNGVFHWNTGDGLNNPFKNNGTNVGCDKYNGDWHHYAVTGDGNVAILYIDGVEVGRSYIYRSLTGSKIYISGWDSGEEYKWVDGSLSDFRLYATTLSAADIKELYQTSASIDKNGNLYCYKLKEG